VKKIFFIFLVIFVTNNFSYSQFKSDFQNNTPVIEQKKVPGTKIGLGIHTGFAFIESSTGFDIGVLADLKLGSGVAITPQVNYWKVDKDNNFELSALLRYNFDLPDVSPYVDGGLGINFLSIKKESTDPVIANQNSTNFGLDLGGGVEFQKVSKNFNLFIDGKYRLQIKSVEDGGNLSGFTLTGGIKFLL